MRNIFCVQCRLLSCFDVIDCASGFELLVDLISNIPTEREDSRHQL